MIFKKISIKRKILKNSKTLKILIILLETVRVLSGIAKLASEFDCSILVVLQI